MAREQFLLEGQPHPRSGVSDVRLDVGHRLDVAYVENQGVRQGSQVLWPDRLSLARRLMFVGAPSGRDVCLQG